jgi:hypothetical protein
MSKPQVAILAIAAVIVVELIAAAIMLSTSNSASSPSSLHSPGPTNGSRTGPLSMPTPSSGAVTLVAVNQLDVYGADTSTPDAPKKMTINVTVVPGADLASSNLVFTLYPAGGGASISPDVQSAPSGTTFNPSSAETQTFDISFSVPATIGAGTLVVNISSGGPELLRQSLFWMMSPAAASGSAGSSASAPSASPTK